ncbi:DUF3410 domain-containing protein, partial [candidate division KSB1 bacterium]|nr:DUF3410 domain-containing protein [candidate division KSB1 bacterium]
KADWDASEALPAPVPDRFQVPMTIQSNEEVLYHVLRQIYDIQADDDNLRGLFQKAVAEQGAYFDHLRKNYRTRREFYNYQLDLPVNRPEQIAVLRQLGFKINLVNLQ